MRGADHCFAMKTLSGTTAGLVLLTRQVSLLSNDIWVLLQIQCYSNNNIISVLLHNLNYVFFFFLLGLLGGMQ